MRKVIGLQQYLPFTVLKRRFNYENNKNIIHVATVLTVYGIETKGYPDLGNNAWYAVATVLTVYGIETK